ncbi:glycosyltransferase [Rhodopirellula maiorica SM1]|uniref:Glycosyltransferase n=1 Tax=Rhodopirellula maiorica SM1 TaxID=1265738 RepID=M5RL25_9BACT|nr:sugar transferase [Rhodopirellula maiorica]EMI16077.1 glycosyltransferase [Rhodopirellula maiorica SM1]
MSSKTSSIAMPLLQATPIQTATKRCFDILASGIGILLLSPLLILITGIIRFTSSGPVLFQQTRVGRNLQPFKILKFRTMVENAPSLGPAITSGDDPRITRIGKLLRKTKLDELPQLFNILKGDMSLVGPRPEVPKYVEMFEDDFRQILIVRPGLTDLASIKYRDESAVLAQADDPEREYVTRILPDKIELAKQYVRCSSIALDVRVILQTLLQLFR